MTDLSSWTQPVRLRARPRTDENTPFRIRLVVLVLAAGATLLHVLPSVSHAAATTNITSDGTLGTTLNGGLTCSSNCTITGGTRPGGGPIVLHGVGRLDVGAGDTANFFNDTGLFTRDIFTRVTGGNPSNIFGTIRTTDFGNANLFLINPAGVLFGPSASLDIGAATVGPRGSGSFHVSTADYVRLFDGTNSAYFYANPAKDSLANSVLSSAPPVDFGFLSPAAFGFTSSAPAPITVDSSVLLVPQGRSLSLVGGDITMTGGTLSAPSGQISLASVASPGEVLVAGLQTAANVNGQSFTAMGAINLSQGATVDVSGDPGGAVLIRGSQFVMDNAFLTANTLGDVGGAATAVSVDVTGSVALANASSILTSASSAGRGGDVSIEGQTVSLTDGSLIISSSGGAGAGGAVTVAATDSVTVSGFSGILSSASVLGKGGDIVISAPILTLDSGFLATIASGDARGGDLSLVNSRTVNVRNSSVIFSSTDGSQAGGNILLKANRVNVLDGSLILSQSQGAGNGGQINLFASDSLSLSGVDVSENPSSILSQAGFNFNTSMNTTRKGGGGDITASLVTLSDPGLISTQTNGLSPAAAGDITLKVGNDLNITSGGTIETISLFQGPSGNIVINAGGTVAVTGRFDANNLSRITNRSISTVKVAGDTRTISIQAGKFLLTGGARVISDTFNAASGDVTIQATDSLQISGGSRISLLADLRDIGSLSIAAPMITVDGQGTGLSTQTVGPGNAGAITLTATAGNLTLSGGSDVTTRTAAGGRGGPVIATATDSVLMSGGSIIQSSSFRTGPAGSITVTAGNAVSLAGAGTGMFGEAFGSANGGAITVKGNQVQLSDNATISAKSTGTGNAGNIQVTASDSLVMQNSSITTQTTQSDGGNIQIQVGRLVKLANSRVTSSVQGGLGNGGNIMIDPQFVTLQNSQILANAFGGNGGNIMIVAGAFSADSTSTISASSTLGINGTVEIQATVSNLSESVAPLPAEIVQAVELLQARCAARLAGGTSGSFVVAGRDGLPLEPGGLLPSPLYVESERSTRLAESLWLPALHVGRPFVESNLTLPPLAIGCSS